MKNYTSTFAIACALALQLLAGCGGQTARPNLILLYTDDQGQWAQGIYNNAEIHTPHTDRIFQEGATFRQAFVTTPVCSPARASLMTSRYSIQHGIEDWIDHRKEQEVGIDSAFTLLPEVLQDAGYATGLIGKWHLGNQPEFHPTQHGFDYFMGFLEGGNKPWDPLLEVNGTPTQLSGPLPDILMDDALAFIQGHQADPFFLSVNFRAPHAPHKPVPEEDDSPYLSLDPTLPDYPNLAVDWLKNLTREYYAAVTSIDRNVGRMLDELDALNLTDNTIVIFTSDHGYNMGHRGIWSKGNGNWALEHNWRDRIKRPNMWDTSLLTPLGIRWPGRIEPSTEIPGIITTLDFYPTILAMLDVESPLGLQLEGTSFLPLLSNPATTLHDTTFGSYDLRHGGLAHMRMIRTPEWKYVVHYEDRELDELYHLATDPDEFTNLAQSPVHATVRQSLEQHLIKWQRSLNDPILP